MTTRRALLLGGTLIATGLALALATLGLAQWPLPLVANSGIDDVFVAKMLEMDAGTSQIAQLADTHAEHAELRRLSKDIVRSIRDDGARMGSRRVRVPLPSLRPVSSHVTDREAVISAPVFDKAFIEVMVSRYESGVDWCLRAMQTAKQERVRTLASDLIASRARELVLMRLYYEVWYGGPSEP